MDKLSIDNIHKFRACCNQAVTVIGIFAPKKQIHRQAARGCNALRRLENIFKIHKIISICLGKTEENNFLRDALLIFRAKTFGCIGAVICCIISVFYIYCFLPVCFLPVSSIAGSLVVGLVSAYISSRLTLLFWDRHPADSWRIYPFNIGRFCITRIVKGGRLVK